MDVHPVGCRLRLARRAEAFEIRESLFSLGGSVDDRGLVAAEDTEPMRHIARMTVMEDVGQTKVSTAEPRPDLRDQFFERIGLVAEALAEGPCESAGMARPVTVMPISA